MALQGCDVFIGLLGVDQDCNLKTRALIHNGQNWELVLGALDPHDIGLDALVEARNHFGGGWCNLIGLPIFEASMALKSACNFQNC